MLTVRWLNGDLDLFAAPLTVGKLSEQIRSRVGRNHVIHLLRCTDEDTETEKETDHQPTLSSTDTLFPNEHVMVLITPECEMRTEESKKVERTFRSVMKYFPNLYDEFVQVLHSTGAIVAGGSVLAGLTHSLDHSFHVNDFDVYVHAQNARELIFFFRKQYRFFFVQHQIHSGSAYDASFFRKNHILFRVPLQARVATHLHDPIKVDLIVVDDAIPLTQVVTRFDLSFCQTWWDGSSAYATDPDGIRERTGYLQPSYRQALFRDLNVFLIRRIRKYRKRGFTVHLTEDPTQSLLELLSAPPMEDGKDGKEEDGKEEDGKDGKEKDRNDDHSLLPARRGETVDAEDWAIRRFLEHELECLTPLARVSHGVTKVAFFFHAYPKKSRLTYQSLREMPCWRDILPTRVEMMLQSNVSFSNLPEAYQEAFVRTFRLDMTRFRALLSLPHTQPYPVGWQEQSKQFLEDMLTGW